MAPLVSVIIPTRDRRAKLEDALASVASQGITDVQVVVINDGGEPVGPVGRYFASQLDTVLLEFEKSAGPSAARNAGVEVATGEYLAFLDDDDIFLPGHLSGAISAIEKDKRCLVTTGAVVFSERPSPLSPGSLSAVEPAGRYGFDNAEQMLPVVSPMTVNSVVCTSFRRDGARFDESLTMSENWDMWLRLTREFGFTIKRVEQETAVYFRELSHSSIINTVTDRTASLRALQETYEKVYKRWPAVPGSAQECARGLVDEMFRIALARLAEGLPNHPFYYIHSLPVFSAYLAGTLDEGAAVAEISRVIAGVSPG